MRLYLAGENDLQYIMPYVRGQDSCLKNCLFTGGHFYVISALDGPPWQTVMPGGNSDYLGNEKISLTSK